MPLSPAGSGAAPDNDNPTDEEIEIMRLVADGVKDEVIARKVNVSTVTVRRRIARFQEKVGAKSRSHAVAIAMREGWL